MAFNWKSLRDYRVSLGLTTDEMAERMGCDRVRVTRIERGLEMMTERDLQALRSHDYRRKEREV